MRMILSPLAIVIDVINLLDKYLIFPDPISSCNYKLLILQTQLNLVLDALQDFKKQFRL